MTRVRGANYTSSETEFTELHDFLSATYGLWDGLHNWGINRFGGWHYDAKKRREDPQFHGENLHLWRNEAGEITGFCVSETGKHMFFQVHPEYRSLEVDMLRWTEEVWGSSRKTVGIVARRGDSYRETLLQEHGYVPERPLECERRFDTTSSYRPVVIPDDFELTTLARLSPSTYMEAANRTFKRGGSLDREWLRSKDNMPGFSRDWVVCAATASGRCASFADVLLDREAGYAEVDPVGTDPEFQRRGLATAVLMECFRRLAKVGIRTAYIGSAPEPYHSNRLYEKCNPVCRDEYALWERV